MMVGRRSAHHNPSNTSGDVAVTGLSDRGFTALSHMPKLRGLSTSCLNVSDAAVALLPEFPALRELMADGYPGRWLSTHRPLRESRITTAHVLSRYDRCRDRTHYCLTKLSRYFNSYTTITDRTPEILSHMQSLESITFSACNNLTNAGVATLARLPRLRELRVSGNTLTREVVQSFPAGVTVHYSH